MRLFSLEQSMQELRADMERRSTELFQQVDSLAKTVQRLDAQVAGHNERSAETQAAGANSCSLEQLRQVVSLTLVELENLTRRANDAFDRSASSSIKQIQELQQLAGNVALRGSPGIHPLGLPVPAKRHEADDAASDVSEATYCSPSMRPREEHSPATLQGSPCARSPECSPGAELRGDEGGQVQNKS